jgi:hypothetical protein
MATVSHNIVLRFLFLSLINLWAVAQIEVAHMNQLQMRQSPHLRGVQADVSPISIRRRLNSLASDLTTPVNLDGVLDHSAYIVKLKKPH